MAASRSSPPPALVLTATGSPDAPAPYADLGRTTPNLRPYPAQNFPDRNGDSADETRDPREYLPEPPPGYDLLRRLGSGGMGTVYLAREHAAERTVAMKILHSPSDPSAFDRFLIEARVLARLDHPNIIKVIAVETNWREPFLTMEYADGGSLADLVKSGEPLPAPADAARLVLGAAEAIAAAHVAGVLHRDLKPSNILLTGREVVRSRGGETLNDKHHPTPPPHHLAKPKVSDFGLAKRTDRDDGLTRTGPIGTPGYMSPEAAAGRYRDVDATSDVYGLGATLYQLLTGRPPFTGTSVDEILQKVLSDLPARPRALRPDLPAGLEAIVVKAMAKEPAARYPTATALANDLRRFLAGQTPAAPVLSPRRRAWQWLVRRRARIAVLVGVVLLATALVVVGNQLRTDPPPPPDAEQVIRDEIAAGKTVYLLGADGRPRSAAWPLGPAELTTKAEHGGTCIFEATDHQALLLLDDPGVDSYQVRAEICQKQKLAHVSRLSHPDANEVGLVLGYAGQDRADGTRVHSMMVLQFSDYDPVGGPQRERKLGLMHLGLVAAPGFKPGHPERFDEVLAAPLERILAADPPAWREVIARVTPAGVSVPGANGRPQLSDPATIAKRRTYVKDQLAKGAYAPVAPFPAWSPRMPVGIWSRGSQVYVRNVTIQSMSNRVP